MTQNTLLISIKNEILVFAASKIPRDGRFDGSKVRLDKGEHKAIQTKIPNFF